MFRVYRAVRDIEINAEKYSFLAKFKGHNKKKTRKRSRRVMIQGILYSVAMVLTWIFTFITVVIMFISKGSIKVIHSLANAMLPLQGAFNFFIYLMPIFRSMLKKRREGKTWRIKKEVLKKNEGDIKKNEILPCELPLAIDTIASSFNEDTRNSFITNNIVPFEEEQEEKQEIHSIHPVSHFGRKIRCEDKEGLIDENQKNSIESDSSTSSDDNGDDYY